MDRLTSKRGAVASVASAIGAAEHAIDCAIGMSASASADRNFRPLGARVVMTEEAQRALVIGSGPIGIDAAIRLAREGFGVTLCEKGSAVAASLRHWSHCRLFSAGALNCSAAGLVSHTAARTLH